MTGPWEMKSAMCPLCQGSTARGWLCADHPDKPWEHDGCGAEGVRCVCNPEGELIDAEVLIDNRERPQERN